MGKFEILMKNTTDFRTTHTQERSLSHGATANLPLINKVFSSII